MVYNMEKRNIRIYGMILFIVCWFQFNSLPSVSVPHMEDSRTGLEEASAILPVITETDFNCLPVQTEPVRDGERGCFCRHCFCDGVISVFHLPDHRLSVQEMYDSFMEDYQLYTSLGWAEREGFYSNLIIKRYTGGNMERMKLCDKVKILLINEDTIMHCLIKNLLNPENYKIYEADNGTMGLQLSTSLCPDIVLLDLKLRDINGMEIISCIREWSDCPIIVISESDAAARKVKALYAGADDYIVKPFYNQELKARIFSVLRRRGTGGHTHPYKAKDLEIDFDRRLVTVRNQKIHFPLIEYRILE